MYPFAVRVIKKLWLCYNGWSFWLFSPVKWKKYGLYWNPLNNAPKIIKTLPENRNSWKNRDFTLKIILRHTGQKKNYTHICPDCKETVHMIIVTV